MANENEAHSDNELAEGGTDSVYHIKEKEEVFTLPPPNLSGLRSDTRTVLGQS